MGKTTVAECMRELWDKLYGGSPWAEIIVPSIAPENAQFIGFLVPVPSNLTLGDLANLTELLGEKCQYKLVMENKMFGSRLRTCLSGTVQFDRYHTQDQLHKKAEQVQNQIHALFKIPVLLLPVINCRDAERRLN